MAGRSPTPTRCSPQYDALPKATSTTPSGSPAADDRAAAHDRPGPDPPRPKFRSDREPRARPFADRLTTSDIAGTNRTTLSGLLDEVGDLLPLTVRPGRPRPDPVQDRVVAFGAELLTGPARCSGRDRRTGSPRPTPALADYDHAVTGPDRVTRRRPTRCKALLGPDVLVVPEYTSPTTSPTTCTRRSTTATTWSST
jgi:hypothetical protein